MPISAACAGIAVTANPQSTKLQTALAKERPDDADNRQIGLIHAPSKARGDRGSLEGKVQCFCEPRNSAKKQQLAGMFAPASQATPRFRASAQWNL
jgi:hypothetical protein